MSRSPVLFQALLSLLLLPACEQTPGAGTPASTAAVTASPAPATSASASAAPLRPSEAAIKLKETRRRLRTRYTAAVAGVRRFADSLNIDPAALDRDGIKGKKKLAELLHVYHRLRTLSPPAEHASIDARVAEVARVVSTKGFHDMASVADDVFTQDATSYLRCAYLMDKLGLDTTAYRKEIEAILPRLATHLPARGVHQRLAFELYYRHFGFAFPEAARASLEDGVIAKRKDPRTLKRFEAYELTHEIFIPYDFGDRLEETGAFDDADRVYLRLLFELLIPREARSGHVDLLAETLSAASYVGIAGDLPTYSVGLELLLSRQNDDGSFGRYPELRDRFSDEHIKYRLVLHTTMVSLDALSAAFAGED